MILVVNKTRVVHCKKEPFDVYIGRPSKWGNPFKIGKDGSREEVIQKYRHWILANPVLVAQLTTELKGKRLGCWCKPYACHGDVLAELADETMWVPWVIVLGGFCYRSFRYLMSRCHYLGKLSDNILLLRGNYVGAINRPWSGTMGDA